MRLQAGLGTALLGGGVTRTRAPRAVVAIDADRPLTTTPGAGAGVFVEYASGGRWHVFTTCDTNLPPHGRCAFEVYVRTADGSRLLGVTGDSLEASDAVDRVDADGADLASDVAADFDGMWIDATPGAVLRVAAWVGSACDGHYTYWNDGDL